MHLQDIFIIFVEAEKSVISVQEVIYSFDLKKRWSIFKLFLKHWISKSKSI